MQKQPRGQSASCSGPQTGLEEINVGLPDADLWTVCRSRSWYDFLGRCFSLGGLFRHRSTLRDFARAFSPHGILLRRLVQLSLSPSLPSKLPKGVSIPASSRRRSGFFSKCMTLVARATVQSGNGLSASRTCAGQERLPPRRTRKYHPVRPLFRMRAVKDRSP